jgi:hypothetical protein
MAKWEAIEVVDARAVNADAADVETVDAQTVDAKSAAGEIEDTITTDDADALLLDDLSVASDLKVKVTEAWHEFARALANVLAKLDNGVHVDLTLDPAATGTSHAVYEVSVQRHTDGKIGALAVSNASLPEGHRLDRGLVAEMVIMGWSPPGVVDGSGKDFGMVGSTADAARIAVAVTKTLRDVYGAPHPAFLTYAAHDADEANVTIEPLATARAKRPGREGLESLRLDDEGFAALEDPQMSLGERVALVVAGMQRTTPDALQVDSDGDIGIRAGSAMVFVRIRENPALVDVFSPILTDVEPSERLYVKLSELTTKMPIGRLYFANKTVWASVPVFGRDFQATHLMLAVQVMTGLADELDDRLHGEFGGRRFFVDADTAAAAEAARDDIRTGMYL